jgi:ribosomal protein L29
MSYCVATLYSLLEIMAKDIKTLSDADLNKQVDAVREEMRELKFKVSGAIKDSFSYRKKRKEVARILTELRARKTN